MKLQLYTRSAVHLLVISISMCMCMCYRVHTFAFAFAPVSTDPLSHRSISNTVIPTIAFKNNVGRPILAYLTAKNDHDHDDDGDITSFRSLVETKIEDNDSKSVSKILEAPTCVELTDNTESELIDRNRIAHEHSRVLINVFTWIALVVESVIVETTRNANANATPSSSTSTPIV